MQRSVRVRALTWVLAAASGCVAGRPSGGGGGGPSTPAEPTAPAISRAALPDGDYACTLADDGVTYAPYRCRVATTDGVIRLDKLEGSQRVRGTVTFEADDRFAFAGELFCNGGGCERVLDVRFGMHGDGDWLGDLGLGASLRLHHVPGGLYGGAGYGGDGYGGTGYGGAGAAAACVVPTATAVSACASGAPDRVDPGPPATSTSSIASVDLSPPPGVPLPAPADRPRPQVFLGNEPATRPRADIVQDLQSLEDLLRSTSSHAADRPSLIWRLASAYRELLTVTQREPASPANDKTIKAAAAAAVKHLASLRRDHPKFCVQTNPSDPTRSTGCGDHALFLLARTHRQVAQVEPMRAVLVELIQSWPSSRFVPGAYLLLGEAFADQARTDPSKWTLAEQTFVAATQAPPPENLVWGAAHLHLCRASWATGDHARALSEAKKAIEYGQQYASLPGAAELAIAARADLVPLFTQAGDPARAFEFFRPLSGDGGIGVAVTLTMIDALRGYYLGANQPADAAALTRSLLGRPPIRDDRAAQCARRAELAIVTRGGRDRAVADADLKALLDAAALVTEPAARPTCAAATISTVVEAALAWDAEAARTGDAALAALAAGLYERVLTGFTDEEVAAASFPRLAARDRPTRATLIDRRTALQGGGVAGGGCATPGGAYQAALCQLAAYDAAHPNGADRVGLDRLTGAGAAPTALVARGFTADEQAWLAAFDGLLCALTPAASPESQARWSRLRFARARSFLDARRWTAAAAGFRELAFDAGAPDAAAAAPLYLEALYEASLAATPVQACGPTLAVEVSAMLAIHCSGGGDPDACRQLMAIRSAPAAH